MKFKRPKGFSGSKSRNWIDNALPVCPFCHNRPLWEFATQFKLSWHLIHFRCPDCMAILSIPVVEIAGPVVGVAWLLRKASQKKIVLKVESIGDNPEMQSYLGKELPLENLQQLASAQAFCGKCGTPMAKDEKFCPKCGSGR